MATGSRTYNLTFGQTVNGVYSGYDRYGNMTCVVNAQTQGPCPSLNFASTTNRINSSGYTYDAAGNLTADGTGTGSHTYQWDGEGRLKSVDSGSTASFVYNALGWRVEKTPATQHEFVYGAGGEELGEYNVTAGYWDQQYFLGAGRILGQYWGSTTFFLHRARWAPRAW